MKNHQISSNMTYNIWSKKAVGGDGIGFAPARETKSHRKSKDFRPSNPKQHDNQIATPDSPQKFNEKNRAWRRPWSALVNVIAQMFYPKWLLRSMEGTAKNKQYVMCNYSLVKSYLIYANSRVILRTASVCFWKWFVSKKSGIFSCQKILGSCFVS